MGWEPLALRLLACWLVVVWGSGLCSQQEALGVSILAVGVEGGIPISGLGICLPEARPIVCCGRRLCHSIFWLGLLITDPISQVGEFMDYCLSCRHRTRFVWL